MSNEYEKFQKLKVDTSCIGLAREENSKYFCTPIGATIIGWDNGIHYIFIKGFDEMVFAVNPDTVCDYYVYPLANNFSDFLSLVLATKGTPRHSRPTVRMNSINGIRKKCGLPKGTRAKQQQ